MWNRPMQILRKCEAVFVLLKHCLCLFHECATTVKSMYLCIQETIKYLFILSYLNQVQNLFQKVSIYTIGNYRQSTAWDLSRDWHTDNSYNSSLSLVLFGTINRTSGIIYCHIFLIFGCGYLHQTLMLTGCNDYLYWLQLVSYQWRYFLNAWSLNIINICIDNMPPYPKVYHCCWW